MYIRRALQVSLFFFLVVLSAPAFAGKAATDAVIVAGSRIRILSIDSGDSNFSQRHQYIGKLGTVDKGNLNNNSEGGTFYSGDIEMDNGTNLNVWKVSIELLGGPAAVKGTLYTGYTVKAGTWVRILDINPVDAAYPTRGKLLGMVCYVGSADLYPSYYGTGAGNYYGTVYCLDGLTRYFQSFSVELITSKLKEKPLLMSTVPLYTRVKIVSISPTDALYSKRATLVGKESFVYSTALTETGTAPSKNPYFAGNLSFFTGYTEYFTGVELSSFELDAPGSLSSGAEIIPVGTKVEIQAIGALDRYYSKRASLEGLFGVVGTSDALRVRGKGSYSGAVTILGVEYQFFDVMVIPIAGGLPSSREMGSASLDVGYRVMILDVSKSDNNYANKAEVVGQIGIVINSPLTPSTMPWYSGAIKSETAGRYLFFSQVAVLPLSLPSGAAPQKETVATLASVPAGQKVRILEIGPTDPIFTTDKKASYLGQEGVVTYMMYSLGTSTNTGGTFYSGTINVGGVPVNFYQVSLNLVP
jgi:hypothetical protein